MQLYLQCLSLMQDLFTMTNNDANCSASIQIREYETSGKAE